MLLLYVLLAAYIFSVNFYSYLLVKALRREERERGREEDAENVKQEKGDGRAVGKLCLVGLLGGAITVYVCLFLLKYKRSNMLLMLLMPVLGALNLYLWIAVFRYGFTFFPACQGYR